MRIIWRWWKISVRIRLQSLKPGEMKQSHEEFLTDDRIQRQISVIFGSKYLECIIGICEGNLDYLERLPTKLETICQLCQTSHDPKQPCDAEQSWEQAVRRSGMEITPETEMLAKNIGWEKIYNTFILNKGQDDSETNVNAGEKPGP
ncbi:F-box only protein 36a isoform X2 [Silurus meridionalis]|uniref:F-box only protein 36a isoform X2 n=1 Tax=Silurus meridionalis TaxID=175797 RepID=UPI001EECB114|nr:F-box only protein 36a isoform X2 [Silurus meridionalis]